MYVCMYVCVCVSVYVCESEVISSTLDNSPDYVLEVAVRLFSGSADGHGVLLSDSCSRGLEPKVHRLTEPWLECDYVYYTWGYNVALSCSPHSHPPRMANFVIHAQVSISHSILCSYSFSNSSNQLRYHSMLAAC